ncbi:tubulin binding cofactor C-domain-containing protein [Flagelloscypha sp. PMI_526]|nr:tubulin binding cofactor C-domain-containing protein [Flagelloscypha sp. PMI_526]
MDTTTSDLAAEIVQRNKDLNDNASELPAYEVRQKTLQVKQLEQTLANLQQPTTKFSFKRSASKPTVPIPQSAASPTSVSPSIQIQSNKLITSVGESLSSLSDCIVSLPSLSALYVSKIQQSILVLPDVKGSLILHDLNNCILLVHCHQFRIHTSSNVTIYISCPSPPIIESCSSLRFISSPFPDSIPFTTAQDFSHVRQDTPSPNWSTTLDFPAITLKEWTSIINIDTESVKDTLERYLKT